MKKTNSIYFNNDVSASEETRVELTNFKGVDFTNSPLLVNSNHSPNSVNMEYREGTNHKRFGFKQKAEVKVWNSSTLNYDYFPINGVWSVTNASGVNETIAHCGDKFFKLDIGANYDGFEYSVVEEIAKPSGSTIKNQKSFGVVKGNKLYILCGDYVVYTNGMLRSVSSDAYTPTTTIQISDMASPPTAITYEPINMLSKKRINKVLSRNKNLKTSVPYESGKTYKLPITLSLYPSKWSLTIEQIKTMFSSGGSTQITVGNHGVINTLIEFQIKDANGQNIVKFGLVAVAMAFGTTPHILLMSTIMDSETIRVINGKKYIQYSDTSPSYKYQKILCDIPFGGNSTVTTQGSTTTLTFDLVNGYTPTSNIVGTSYILGNNSGANIGNGGDYFVMSIDAKGITDAYSTTISSELLFMRDLLPKSRIAEQTTKSDFVKRITDTSSSTTKFYNFIKANLEIPKSVTYQLDILPNEELTLNDFSLDALIDGVWCKGYSKNNIFHFVDNNGNILEEESEIYKDFSVRYGYKTGLLTLSEGFDSPQEGVSNITINLTSNLDFGASKIANCTIGEMFGYGELEELFVSGNPNYPNYDWHSTFVGVDDLSFFGDTSYTSIGSSTTKILGYARLDNNEMAIFKEESANSPSIYIRTSTLAKDILLSNENLNVYNTQYSIASCAIGLGALNNSCIQNLANDILFLNKNGVYSLDLSSNLKGNVRYALERSEPINNKLLKEKDLQNAVAVVFDNRYYLAVNGNVYIADARFKQQSEEMMDDTFSYEWYYWEGVNVRTWFVLNGKLAFGTDDGRICVFTNEDFVDVTTQTISSGNGEIIVYASGLSDIDVPANTIGDNFNASAIQIRDSFIPTIGDKKKVNVYQTLDYRVLQPIDCLLTRYVHDTMNGGFLKGTYNNKYCLVVYCSTFTNNGLYEKLSKLDYVYDGNGFKYQVAIDMEKIEREVIKLIPMYDEFHTEEMAIEVFNNKSWRYFYFKLSEVNVIKCTYGGVDYYVIQDPTKKELVEGDTYENCLANGVKLKFDFSSDEEYFIFENIEEKVVNSCWNTKFFDGGDKTLIKKIKGVYVVTGKGKFDISIDAQKKNGFVKTYAVNNLDFENVNFENFVLSSDKNLQTLFQKMAINNVNFFQVKLENNENIDSVLYCLGVITQKLERIKGVK